MSVLYRKQFPTIHFEPIFVLTIVVERVPCCVSTSNSLALTILMVPLIDWLKENQSIFPHESRTAVVLKDNLKIISEVIRGIVHLFFLYSLVKKKKKCSWFNSAYS